MHHTLLHFPETRLTARDAHKLRGYFSALFGQRSDLWHNHRADGRPIYRYPLIQYKVVDGRPLLVGLGEGAQLLVQHFLEVRELDIDGLRLPVHSKQVRSSEQAVGADGALHRYQFESPWFALNQRNYPEYEQAAPAQRTALLQRLLTGHILAFFKGVGHWEEQQIMVLTEQLRPLTVRFKDQPMQMFRGSFVANVRLPDHIGLGKSVARGYGTVQRIKN